MEVEFALLHWNGSFQITRNYVHNVQVGYKFSVNQVN